MHQLTFASILNVVVLVAPVAVGALGGYLWYRVVGCRTGSCPITSNPWASTIYGAVIGAMFIGR
jgi:hypothetical protein